MDSFAVGAVSFALAIRRSGLLTIGLTWLVIAALVVMLVAQFVPLSAAQIVISAATILLWPSAAEMRSDPSSFAGLGWSRFQLRR